MKPETRFRQNQVIPFLKKLRNTYFDPIQQVAIHGSPDFYLCVHGRMVGFELKSETGAASELQKFKGAQISRTGGLYLVAHPNNWRNIKTQLSKMDASKEYTWGLQL